MKKLFKTLGILTILVAVGIGSRVTLHAMRESQSDPVLVFKDDISFALGQLSFEESEGENKLPTITPESILVLSESDYDIVSFNQVACGNEPQDMMFRFLDTGEIGNYEGTVYASKGSKCKSFTFNYAVE